MTGESSLKGPCACGVHIMKRHDAGGMPIVSLECKRQLRADGAAADEADAQCPNHNTDPRAAYDSAVLKAAPTPPLRDGGTPSVTT
jgi:hypothetical protein